MVATVGIVSLLRNNVEAHRASQANSGRRNRSTTFVGRSGFSEAQRKGENDTGAKAPSTNLSLWHILGRIKDAQLKRDQLGAYPTALVCPLTDSDRASSQRHLTPSGRDDVASLLSPERAGIYDRRSPRALKDVPMLVVGQTQDIASSWISRVETRPGPLLPRGLSVLDIVARLSGINGGGAQYTAEMVAVSDAVVQDPSPRRQVAATLLWDADPTSTPLADFFDSKKSGRSTRI